jgi:hypothetical protein
MGHFGAILYKFALGVQSPIFEDIGSERQNFTFGGGIQKHGADRRIIHVINPNLQHYDTNVSSSTPYFLIEVLEAEIASKMPVSPGHLASFGIVSHVSTDRLYLAHNLCASYQYGTGKRQNLLIGKKVADRTLFCNFPDM